MKLQPKLIPKKMLAINALWPTVFIAVIIKFANNVHQNICPVKQMILAFYAQFKDANIV